MRCRRCMRGLSGIWNRRRTSPYARQAPRRFAWPSERTAAGHPGRRHQRIWLTEEPTTNPRVVAAWVWVLVAQALVVLEPVSAWVVRVEAVVQEQGVAESRRPPSVMSSPAESGLDGWAHTAGAWRKIGSPSRKRWKGPYRPAGGRQDPKSPAPAALSWFVFTPRSETHGRCP